MKSMRLKYGLSKENPVRELPTVTDKKSPIGHNIKHLSDSEVLKKPDLPPGIAPWLNDRDRKEYNDKWQNFWLETRKVKSTMIEALQEKWKHQYNTGERGRHEWYSSTRSSIHLNGSQDNHQTNLAERPASHLEHYHPASYRS
jgi:hypothetical protein